MKLRFQAKAAAALMCLLSLVGGLASPASADCAGAKSQLAKNNHSLQYHRNNLRALVSGWAAAMARRGQRNGASGYWVSLNQRMANAIRHERGQIKLFQGRVAQLETLRDNECRTKTARKPPNKKNAPKQKWTKQQKDVISRQVANDLINLGLEIYSNSSSNKPTHTSPKKKH